MLDSECRILAIHPSLVDPMTYGQVEGCFSTAPWLFFEVTKAMSKSSVWDAEGKEATAFKNFQQSLWGHFSMAKSIVKSIEYTNWISPIQVRREVTSEKHAFGRHFVFLMTMPSQLSPPELLETKRW